MTTTLVSIPTATKPLDGAYYEPEGRAPAGAVLSPRQPDELLLRTAALPAAGADEARPRMPRVQPPRTRHPLDPRQPRRRRRRLPERGRGNRRQPDRRRVAGRPRLRAADRHRPQPRWHARGAPRRRSPADAGAGPAVGASRRQRARPRRERRVCSPAIAWKRSPRSRSSWSKPAAATS